MLLLSASVMSLIVLHDYYFKYGTVTRIVENPVHPPKPQTSCIMKKSTCRYPGYSEFYYYKKQITLRFVFLFSAFVNVNNEGKHYKMCIN